MTDFKVDGGRYAREGARLGDCDTCGAAQVPCTSVPAAEDPSETGVCEACVKSMQAAFDQDRAAAQAAERKYLLDYAADCRSIIEKFRAHVWYSSHDSSTRILPPRLVDVDALLEVRLPT